MRRDFIVYAHYTKDTNELFYIGEGTLERAYRNNHRNRWWNFKVEKHHGFDVEILYSNLTKEEAQEIETILIQIYKNKSTDKLVNICIGPMFKNHWMLNISKEQHPMWGKKNPTASERMKKWNKDHSGKNHPRYNKPNLKVIERNKTGNFKRFSKKVMCNETGQIFNSIKEASSFYNRPDSKHINQHLSGKRKTALGHTWKYV